MTFELFELNLGYGAYGVLVTGGDLDGTQVVTLIGGDWDGVSLLTSGCSMFTVTFAK
jgi:hypothetical protein